MKIYFKNIFFSITNKMFTEPDSPQAGPSNAEVQKGEDAKDKKNKAS